jgi:hypothetical protein
MRSEDRELAYLWDMPEAVRDIVESTNDLSYAAFLPGQEDTIRG